jgi:hypothetical protein
VSYLGVELASRPKFECKDLRSKDLNYISALQSAPVPLQQNSNRDTKLLESALTLTKQSPVTHPNRDTTRLFANRNKTQSLRLPRPSPVKRRTTHLAISPAIQNPKQPAKRRKTPKSDPQFLFRLETHPPLCFVQLSKILIEPMFRLEMSSERIKIVTRTRTNSDGKNQNRDRNASASRRIKNYPRWEFT